MVVEKPHPKRKEQFKNFGQQPKYSIAGLTPPLVSFCTITSMIRLRNMFGETLAKAHVEITKTG